MTASSRPPAEIPSWAEFLAFQGKFDQCLSRISDARRGRPQIREAEIDGITHVVAFRPTPGLYSLDVRASIDEGCALLSAGPAGEWITRQRSLSLTQITLGSFASFEKGINAPADENVRAEWLKLRAYQSKERELRFFGEFALIHGMFFHRTWAPCSTTVGDVKRVIKQQDKLHTNLKSLLADRYFRRHLSPQDLAAVPQLIELLEGLTESFQFVVKSAPALHPFERFHTEEDRGIRQAIAVEVIELCLHCFGHYDKRTLNQLLTYLGMELPSALPIWLEEQAEKAKKHFASHRKTSRFINAKLFSDEIDDPRRPFFSVLPWLDKELADREALATLELKP